MGTKTIKKTRTKPTTKDPSTPSASNNDPDKDKSNYLSSISLYNLTSSDARAMLSSFQQMAQVRVRKYLCPICGNILSSLVSLLRHVRSHSLIAPFQCLHPHCNDSIDNNKRKKEKDNNNNNQKREKKNNCNDMTKYEETKLQSHTQTKRQEEDLSPEEEDEEKEEYEGVFFPTFNLLYLHTLANHGIDGI